MALFGESDTIPRWIYDQKCKDYDDLLNKYHQLRPLQSASNPIKIIPPKPDSAVQTLDAMEQSVRDPRIEAAVKKLMEDHPNLTASSALREAKKLLDVATGKADAPALGPAMR